MTMKRKLKQEFLVELLGARFDVTQSFSANDAVLFAGLAFEFFNSLNLLNEELIEFTDEVEEAEGETQNS